MLHKDTSKKSGKQQKKLLDRSFNEEGALMKIEEL
jgi:hypothetical protein